MSAELARQRDNLARKLLLAHQTIKHLEERLRQRNRVIAELTKRLEEGGQ